MKKLLSILLTLVLTLSALCVVAVPVDAVDDPYGIISGYTLDWETEDVNLAILTEFWDVPEGAEKGVMIFTGLPSVTWYDYDAADYILTESEQLEFDYVCYDVFFFDDYPAEHYVDYVYSVPYVKIGDNVYYGEVDKYSVLQYCFNTTYWEIDWELEEYGMDHCEILWDIQNRGAQAQIDAGYRTDSLCDENYVMACLEDGTFIDGFYYELVREGNTVHVFADDEESPYTVWYQDGESVVAFGNDCDLLVVPDEYGYRYNWYVAEPFDMLLDPGLIYASNGDGTCTVTGYEEEAYLDFLIIPEESPEGDTVVGIDERAFSQCNDLYQLIIPPSVKEIDSGAFYGCENLTNVVIAGQDTWIGLSAFGDCESLSYLNIQPGTIHVGSSAFAEDSALKYVNVPDTVMSIGVGAFESCEGLISLTVPFVGCSYDAANPADLEEAFPLFADIFTRSGYDNPNDVIPSNLTFVTVTGDYDIGAEAFMQVETDEIIIAGNVGNIGDDAFADTDCIWRLVLPPQNP